MKKQKDFFHWSITQLSTKYLRIIVDELIKVRVYNYVKLLNDLHCLDYFDKLQNDGANIIDLIQKLEKMGVKRYVELGFWSKLSQLFNGNNLG